MKLKTWIIILVVALVLSVIFLIYSVVKGVLNYEHIADENGSDTSLTTMTIEDLETRNYRFGAKNYCLDSRFGQECTGFTVKNGIGASDVDSDDITHSADLMSGTMIAQEEYVSEGEDITYTIDSELTSGNMQIIIIGPDLSMEMEVDVNQRSVITLENCAKGEYLVVVGAESAEFTLDIDVDVE